MGQWRTSLGWVTLPLYLSREEQLSLNVYLHFNGTCRQAFEFYRSIFGGDFDLITTFGEGPPDFTSPEDERDNVMHVSYRIGDMVLMGSDTPSTFGPPTVMGNNFSLSYAPNSKEEMDEMFAKLLAGGTVSMPPADMFWGAYFGPAPTSLA